MLVSRRVQAFAAYEHGVLVRWGPVGTGKAATPTDTGLFFTNWKSRTTISTDDPSWILDWYVNFIALKGVAFHQYELPGMPASHGCVRMLEADARWMYTWAEQWVPGRGSDVKRYGTPVLVFGDWQTGAPARGWAWWMAMRGRWFPPGKWPRRWRRTWKKWRRGRVPLRGFGRALSANQRNEGSGTLDLRTMGATP